MELLNSEKINHNHRELGIYLFRNALDFFALEGHVRKSVVVYIALKENNVGD
jgi:hypothetical protein